MKKTIILLAAIITSFNVNAATVTTGTLTYDNMAGTITDSVSGTYYLGWNLASGLTHAQTVAETSSGGLYAAYHIASQTEARQFYLRSDPTNLTYRTDGTRFGQNAHRQGDFKWFLSDTNPLHVGRLSSYTAELYYQPGGWTLAYSQLFTQGSRLGHYGFLLVSDTALIATPIPAALFMFAPALLGFFGLRRRKVQA